VGGFFGWARLSCARACRTSLHRRIRSHRFVWHETRLTELFPGQFKNLRIYVSDPYDLILSKLERNSPKDREDVGYLVDKLNLDPNLLRERYEREQRPNLSNESRHDLTLKLWLDLFPPRAQSST